MGRWQQSLEREVMARTMKLIKLVDVRDDKMVSFVQSCVRYSCRSPSPTGHRSSSALVRQRLQLVCSPLISSAQRSVWYTAGN